jgi:hypothetical protein
MDTNTKSEATFRRGQWVEVFGLVGDDRRPEYVKAQIVRLDPANGMAYVCYPWSRGVYSAPLSNVRATPPAK